MAENSRIEWCDHTFNPWYGCTKVSPGCDHCYAEARMDTRLHRVQWGAGQPRVRTKTWGDPVRWNKQHEGFFAAHGRRQRVFCASLADVFDNEVPAEWRADLFRLIRETPHLDWLLLTKRIGNAAAMIAEAQGDGAPISKWAAWPLSNVWIGATVVNQEEADRDIPKLLATPARVRFLSMEPLLGPVDLKQAGAIGENQDDIEPFEMNYWGEVDWVIVGGESGHGARPMHPAWVRDIRDQCAAAGVPFLFKQWGEFVPCTVRNDGDGPFCSTLNEAAGLVTTRPTALEKCHIERIGDQAVWRVGKKAAGRLLDGVTHDAFPEPRP